jgi:thiamine biosynthesis protein ThiS
MPGNWWVVTGTAYHRKGAGPRIDLGMRVLVNGREREVPEGATVADLVREMGLEKQACAAEVNKRLVPRGERDTTALDEGDVVELVTLVGGG